MAPIPRGRPFVVRATAAVAALALAAFGVPAAARAEPVAHRAAVDNAVLDALAVSGQADFLVHLRARADLATAAALTDRVDRTATVHQRLIRTAADSQRGIRTELD